MTKLPTLPPGPAAGTPAPPGFRQRLGLFDATMLVAGTMIGSGIFIVSADIARDVGSTGWLIAVWVLTGLLTVVGALSYAEMAAMMPHAGGQYVYLREAYGPVWGFLYGWTSFLVIQTGTIAAVGVAFSKYLGVLVPELGTDAILLRIDLHALHLKVAMHLPWMEGNEKLVFFERQEFTLSAGQLVGLVVIVLLTLLNCRGVREGKWVQNIFGVAKVLALLLLIVLGLTVALDPEALRDNFSNLWAGATDTKKFGEVQRLVPFAGLAAVMVAGGAMVGSLFSSDAWGNVTFTAGEVKNPRRNLPLSLALGTGLVTVLYLLANGAYLAALPLHGDAELAATLKAEMAAGKAETGILAAEVRKQDAEALRQDALTALAEARAAESQKEGNSLEAEHALADAARRKAEAAQTRATKQRAEAALRDWVEGQEQLTREKYAQAVTKLGISQARDDRVGTAALQKASPRFGVPFMAIAIMVSTFGCLNGLILMGPRLYYAMANDGLFFRSVGGLNARGVPAAGLLFQAAWSIVLLFSGTYGELLDYVIFAALLFYVLTVGGLFVLRRKLPNAERPYRAFGYPWLPALYVGLCAALMLDLLVVRPIYSWPSFIIVLSGIPAYFFWRWLGRRRLT